LVRRTHILAAVAGFAAAALMGCGRGETPAAATKEPAREVAAVPGAGAVDGPTLKAIRERGRLVCGVPEERQGFATRDVLGWRGFDIDLCRAVAAAVFGDARQVRFVPLGANDRFVQLQAGEIDLIPRGSISFTRDAGFGVDFVGISFYDEQGFLVPRTFTGAGPVDLAGRTVCVQAASAPELNLADYFSSQKARPKSMPLESNDAAATAYRERRCEALTGDFATLAAVRANLRSPDDHLILAGAIAKDPQGPFVRQGDGQWSDIVRWTLNAMILAEELGVTSRTVSDDRREPKSPEVQRLLTGDPFGPMLMLPRDWAYQVIRQVGNYGEVFDRNLGPDTDLAMERRRNALWNAEVPGLLYAPPIR
jgi:general L-amino acid transport system substrate-binding protein